MSDEWEQLEASVERDMALLGDLPPVVPSAACVQRMKDAVGRAALQYQRRRRLLRMLESAGAVAAAIVLAVVLRWPLPASAPSVYDADTYVRTWAVAAEESNDQLASLFGESGRTSTPATDEGEDAALDDLLNNLGLVLGSGV
jgi:hypothetical protein